MDLGLEGKTAVVLASTAGLGRAVATSLLAEGARVAISGRDEARLTATLSELSGRFGDRVSGTRLDVRELDALAHHLDDVQATLGPIDVLVWNSGGPPPQGAAAITGQELDDAYGLLLKAAVHAIGHVLPAMRARRFGRIIAITSLAVRQPIPTLALSNVMRSGLTAWLKSLSLEVARDGVTVNSVCTGMFETDRLRSLLHARATTSGRPVAEERAAMENDIPAGRLGRPEEYGDLVAFLASERAGYLNGVALPLDGGFLKAML